MGRSIGTGPSCHISCYRNPRALILLMPFKSIRNIAQNYTKNIFLANSLIGDFFNNFDRIKEMKPNKPVLIIHGENDDVIPYQHSLDLYSEI